MMMLKKIVLMLSLNRSIYFIRWCHKWMCKRTASDFIAPRFIHNCRTHFHKCIDKERDRGRKRHAIAYCLPELSSSSAATFLFNSSQLMHKSIQNIPLTTQSQMFMYVSVSGNTRPICI